MHTVYRLHSRQQPTTRSAHPSVIEGVAGYIQGRISQVENWDSCLTSHGIFFPTSGMVLKDDQGRLYFCPHSTISMEQMYEVQVASSGWHLTLTETATQVDVAAVSSVDSLLVLQLQFVKRNTGWAFQSYQFLYAGVEPVSEEHLSDYFFEVVRQFKGMAEFPEYLRVMFW